MSLDPETRNQAYQFFIAEAPELLQAIETGLLTLNEEYNIPKVHDIMRSAHSLKGGAASVGLEAISAIAHRLEDIFRSLYHAEDKITPELELKLLQGYDCLQKPLRKQIETGDYDPEKAIIEAENILTDLESILEEAIEQGKDFIPSAEDLGVDMVSSILEVDVQQGIDHLKTVINNPKQYEVIGEVRTQAEVLTGLAEITGLIGLGEVVQSAIAALDNHPESLLKITEILVKDLEAGRKAFLSGEDRKGGQPSPELLAYIQPEIAIEVAQDPSTLTVSADELFGDGDDLEDILTIEEQLQETPDPSTLSISLDETLTVLNENFEQLEQADELTVPFVPSPPPESPVTPSKKQAHSPSSKPSIRVEVNSLQTMDNQLGELVIQRNSLAVQNEQLQRELRELLSRFSRFRRLVGHLQEFSDQEIIRQSNRNLYALQGKTQSSSFHIAEQPESVLEIDFDTLQLDQYGALNSTLQELLEETAQLEESVEDVSLFAQQSDQTLKGQQKQLEQLREQLIWARMLPLSDILDRFPRILREFSYQYEKPTRLTLEGTGVKVDKSVLEKLYDPLTHLVRNAFDHGIESPQERQKAGKPETGEIAIQAYYQGNQTVIEIRDDGRGIDLEKVKEKALAISLLNQEQGERSSTERLYNLLFEPGFSTAETVSELSGRGVGLDVVREQLEQLKGTIRVRSQPGKGTTFILNLPTTQSMAKLLVVLAKTAMWALPSDNIEQILVPTSQQIKQTGKQRFLQLNNQVLPILKLNDLLEYYCPIPPTSYDLRALGAIERPEDKLQPLLILKRGGQRYPLEIDRVITEQELVIKSLGRAIHSPESVSGCTILGDGNLVPVMDVFALLETVQKTSQSAVVGTSSDYYLTPQTATILVVDDSATQRQTLTFSLQRSGYQVLQAGDGREAISMLQRYPQINLIVCDIEMPNLNGFEFLRYRRQDETLNQIPVVMLTSRSSDKHRQLCKHLGASHYFTKPYLEKEFMNVLQEIINH